jgi:hypothetical protein
MYPPRLLQGNLQPGLFLPEVGVAMFWRLENRADRKLRDIPSKWLDSIRLYLVVLGFVGGVALAFLLYIPLYEIPSLAEPTLGKPGSWARTAIVTVLTCSSGSSACAPILAEISR